jgi:streptomycin 6-kinase
MERLRIHPRSRESAQGMLAVLSGFHAELLESAEGYEIVVTLGRDGRDEDEIAALLNALEQYFAARGTGPARLELGGRSYLMRPEEG